MSDSSAERQARRAVPASTRLRLLRQICADFGRAVRPAPHQPQPALWPAEKLTAAWLGHATVLVNFFGVRILTDPVLFARCGLRLGPLTLGPKRYVASALPPAALPPIDLVLLTHAHLDHLDLRSLHALPRDTVVVTAGRTADVFRGVGFREVIELDWDETRAIQTARGGVTISAFKLQHWGARMQHDDFRRYNAYVLERQGRRLCHMGDTARTDARVLSSRGPVDLLCAPIGAYHPWIHAHCTPEEAAVMAAEAGARYVMPIHHQTFKLSWEPMAEPIARFRAALDKQADLEDRKLPRLALTEIGETFVLPG